MKRTVRGNRAAVYLRISSDREGDALGVDRQREDCQTRAEREGWLIVGIFTDNDTGASSKSAKARPEYSQMLTSARRGDFDIILAYSTSRLTRRPMEYEDLIQLSERHGTQIRTIVSGDDNLSTADGQFAARIKAAVDAAESARISERVSRKALENASRGKFGGGRRPFGFEPDGETIREDEAEEINRATQAVIRGASVRSIARDLNSRGVLTSTGARWTSLAVRDLLMRPRNSGQMKYSPTEWDDRGRKKSNRSNKVIGPASWPPIVSEEERLAVQAILSDPQRRTSPGNQPAFLGSGVYFCGVCGQPVRTAKSGNRETRYVCRGKNDGTNHLSRNVKRTDEVVNRQVIDWLHRAVRKARSEGLSQRQDTEWSSLTDELFAVQQRQKDIKEDYAAGYFERAEFRAAIDKLKARELEIHDKMSAGPTVALDQFYKTNHIEEVRLLWTSQDLDTRRSIIKKTLTITILPSSSRGTHFDDASISISPAKDPFSVVSGVVTARKTKSARDTLSTSTTDDRPPFAEELAAAPTRDGEWLAR